MLTIAGLWLAATPSMAAITATSDDFDSSTGTFPSWVSVGTSSADIQYDSTSEKDWWDGDDSTWITNYVGGTNMVITGDELLNDGGLRLDVANTIVGDEAMGLSIAGTMEANRIITLTGNFYNDNSSYTDVKAQLWNATDDILLAETDKTRVVNYNNTAYNTVDFTVKYAIQASDTGDTLQVRFIDQGTATARDVFVDYFSVSSEQGTYLEWNFNSDGLTGTVLTNDLSQFDYTSQQGYDVSNTVANTLAFHGKSSSTDYIIRDKGGVHAHALYLKTVNTINTDFGIYIQKMDYTIDGLNSSNITRVSWSFDITGYDQNGLLNPTNWTVNVQAENNSPFINVSDAWFSDGVVAQTFTWVDDSTGETAKNGTWTTVSGFYDIPVGAAGTNGAIQISTDAGGYTSSGGIFLDNIQIMFTSIEPILDELFENWANSYGITNAVATDNPDGDALDNLYEYGLGGDPTNGNDIGYIPVNSVATDGGSNWFYYIYPQRIDASVAGLNYYLETDTDLINTPGWTNGNYEVLGTGMNEFGSGFNAVTNRVTTETEAKQFIKLQIDGL